MATKKTKTAKRRTKTNELPKSKDVKTETLKKVKGGIIPDLKGWDQKKIKV